jgi:hypothetical protein
MTMIAATGTAYVLVGSTHWMSIQGKIVTSMRA